MKLNKTAPNLFIPGAAKSGTSALHNILNSHPEVCMSEKKEPYYWIKKEFDDYDETIKNDYLNLFNQKPNATYRGESSTAYMLFPHFFERLEKFNPNTPKFIFILRNPIDRLYSHYWYLKGVGSESNDLKAAVLSDKDFDPNYSNRLPEGRYKYYFQYGLYYKWLTRFYKHYNADQIKVLVFEDFKKHPLKVANECFEFLGLKPIDSLPEVESNKTVILKFGKLHKYAMRIVNGKVLILKPFNKIVPRFIKTFLKKHTSNFIINLTKTKKEYPKLSQEERSWLKDLYNDDVQQLKQLTGLQLKEWTDFNTL